MIRFARILGYAVQSIVLGVLLAEAIARILAMVTHAVVFRYQGF
jgi:hypothetical protein